MLSASAVTIKQIELKPTATDGISRVKFANNSNHIIVSSWDEILRLYNSDNNTLLVEYQHNDSILDCCYNNDDTMIFSAGLSGQVKCINITDGSQSILGKHNKGVRCLNYNNNLGVVISGSWDNYIKVWDPRAADSLVGSYEQKGKIFAMDMINNRLVIGTSGRHIQICDIRRMHKPEQLRESSLIHQTRSIKCFPDGSGYALGSIEGRVSVEYFDPDPKTQELKYAFKCHRKTIDNVQHLYPVNAITFHPIYGTFATGGSDGNIYVWDGKRKKRICQYKDYPTSIASLDFNHDGTLLAIASSYTFERGERDHPQDTVFIRTINDQEVRHKAATTA